MGNWGKIMGNSSKIMGSCNRLGELYHLKHNDVNRCANPLADLNECVVCFEQIKTKIALVPCGHTTVCIDCSTNIIKTSNKCPLCNIQLSGTLRLF